MIVLITGDTGFIGTNMKKFLQEKKISVVPFSRRNGFNLLDKKQLQAAAKHCDLVYHFAAEAKPGQSVLNPVDTIELNLKVSLNVLEACKNLSIPLIYPSSCEIYGNSEIPIQEDFALKPTNPYAASKAAIDRICYTYFYCYNLDVKIVRLFNPYGPNQQLNKIIPTFYYQAIRNKPITVYGDGFDTRDYVYIEDIICGLWLARNMSAGEAVNLATGVSTTNLEVANLIREFVPTKSEVNFVEYPKIFGGIRCQIGSGEKALNLIGWKPRKSLRDGIKETLKWLSQVYPEEDMK